MRSTWYNSRLDQSKLSKLIVIGLDLHVGGVDKLYQESGLRMRVRTYMVKD
jgi:hypothetical protein